MIGSYAFGQQAFLEQSNIAERDPSDMAELPEQEVIRRAQLGDAAAFECIYRWYGSRIYALCLRMLGNRTEAEDLTQEAFLRVLRKIQTFRGESAFSTWLHRVAVNAVLMRLREKTLPGASTDRTNEPDDPRVGLHEKLGGPDLLLAGSIDRVNLERALDRLAPRHKLVVELHDIQGYKHHEIAQITGWSIGNSKAQLHRARKRLRELLQVSLHLRWATACGR